MGQAESNLKSSSFFITHIYISEYILLFVLYCIKRHIEIMNFWKTWGKIYHNKQIKNTKPRKVPTANAILYLIRKCELTHAVYHNDFQNQISQSFVVLWPKAVNALRLNLKVFLILLFVYSFSLSLRLDLLILANPLTQNKQENPTTWLTKSSVMFMENSMKKVSGRGRGQWEGRGSSAQCLVFKVHEAAMGLGTEASTGGGLCKLVGDVGVWEDNHPTFDAVHLNAQWLQCWPRRRIMLLWGLCKIMYQDVFSKGSF